MRLKRFEDYVKESLGTREELLERIAELLGQVEKTSNNQEEGICMDDFRDAGVWGVQITLYDDPADESYQIVDCIRENGVLAVTMSGDGETVLHDEELSYDKLTDEQLRGVIRALEVYKRKTE